MIPSLLLRCGARYREPRNEKSRKREAAWTLN
jgi:hypothetical protein